MELQMIINKVKSGDKRWNIDYVRDKKNESSNRVRLREKMWVTISVIDNN